MISLRKLFRHGWKKHTGRGRAECFAADGETAMSHHRPGTDGGRGEGRGRSGRGGRMRLEGHDRACGGAGREMRHEMRRGMRHRMRDTYFSDTATARYQMLSDERCGLCDKNCSLSAPRCEKGLSRAAENKETIQ